MNTEICIHISGPQIPSRLQNFGEEVEKIDFKTIFPTGPQTLPLSFAKFWV